MPTPAEPAPSSRQAPLPPLLADYAAHLLRRGSRPRTVESYGCCLAIYAGWLVRQGLDAAGVAAGDLERFRLWLANEGVNGRGVGAGRQQYYVAVLRDCYRHAAEAGAVAASPALYLEYPKVPRPLPRGVLSPPQLRALLDAPPSDDPLGLRDRLAVRLLALSGLRASEATSLDAADADLGRGELAVREGKGGRGRIVFLDAGTRDAIRQYLAARGDDLAPLLLGHGGNAHSRGRRLTRCQLNERVKLHARSAGLAGRGVTCHALRRTFCTLMLRAGVNLRAVGELAGHAKLGTTARYTRLDDAELARVYDRCFPDARTPIRRAA